MAKDVNSLTYSGIVFDSKEEIEFYQWCEEAELNNLIESFEYQPKEFILSEKKTQKVKKPLKTKVKWVDKHLLHPHIYTADFKIVPKDKSYDWLNKHLVVSVDGHFWIDVKGAFQLYDGARSFSINQKWIYDKFHVYINKVVPKKFFSLTFAPQNARFTPKTNKKRKIYEKCKTIDQILLDLESTNS
jgi:hypothetical protein